MHEANTEVNAKQNNIFELDLAELMAGFFRVARKRWWLFLLLIAAGIGSLWGIYSLRYNPMYQCEATFTVSTGENKGLYYSASAADQMSKTFPYILDSGYFRSVLMDSMGKDSLNGTISAQTIENSNMVTMKVVSSSPDDARDILTTALEVYPEVSRFVLGDIELHLIDEIQTPTTPYNALSLRNVVILGGCAGFCLAAGIILLMTIFNNTVKTAEDMERFTSLECLGALPEVKQKARKKSHSGQYISILDPRTPYGFRESIGSLAVRLRSAMNARGAKTILVTSSGEGEGKSTIAIDLAEYLAQGGSQVLLVDLDLRRQQDAGLLGFAETVSVADALKDCKTLKLDFIQFSNKLGFYFWGGQKKEKNPAGLLGNPKLREILRHLNKQVDYMILDTPPCGMFQDAAVVADCADVSLLVVRYDAVTNGNVMEALSMLDANQTPVIGYVLNAYPQVASHYGYRRYGGYGYGKYADGKYTYGTLPGESADHQP